MDNLLSDILLSKYNSRIRKKTTNFCFGFCFVFNKDVTQALENGACNTIWFCRMKNENLFCGHIRTYGTYYEVWGIRHTRPQIEFRLVGWAGHLFGRHREFAELYTRTLRHWLHGSALRSVYRHTKAIPSKLFTKRMFKRRQIRGHVREKPHPSESFPQHHRPSAAVNMLWPASTPRQVWRNHSDRGGLTRM